MGGAVYRAAPHGHENSEEQHDQPEQCRSDGGEQGGLGAHTQRHQEQRDRTEGRHDPEDLTGTTVDGQILAGEHDRLRQRRHRRSHRPTTVSTRPERRPTVRSQRSETLPASCETRTPAPHRAHTSARTRPTNGAAS